MTNITSGNSNVKWLPFCYLVLDATALFADMHHVIRLINYLYARGKCKYCQRFS